MSYDVYQYGDQKQGKVFLNYEDYICRISDTQKWNVPDKIIVSAAVTGSFFDRNENPNQPYTVEEIYRECEECVEAGASSIHVQVRKEDTGFPCGDIDLYRRIIEPLKAKYGSKVIIDGCAQLGPTTADMMSPVTEGLFEVSPVNTTAVHVAGTVLASSRQVCQAQAKIFQDCGCKVQIAVHDSGHIDNAKRWLIDTGIVQKPYYFIILPSLSGSLMMPNPLAMFEGLAFMLHRIREIDPDCVVMVCAAGRASGYIIGAATLLGIHVRVGMEDTIFMLPHRDDRIVHNADVVRMARDIARPLGRELATADEYREIVGIKKREGVKV